MDPSKLDAFANAGPAPSEADMMEDDAEAEGGEEEAARDFGALIGALSANAEDLEACCDEIAPEALTDTDMELSDTDLAILQEGYDSMDRKVQKEFDAVSPLSPDEAMQVATELENSGAVEDAERVAGYLQRLGELVQGGGEGVEEEEPDEDEDEFDDEEY